MITIFEDIDRKVIVDLAAAVANQSVTPREVADIVRQRQYSLWSAKYTKLYDAIQSAAELRYWKASKSGVNDPWEIAASRNGVLTVIEAEDAGVPTVEVRKLAYRGALRAYEQGVYTHRDVVHRADGRRCSSGGGRVPAL